MVGTGITHHPTAAGVLVAERDESDADESALAVTSGVFMPLPQGGGPGERGGGNSGLQPPE